MQTHKALVWILAGIVAVVGIFIVIWFQRSRRGPADFIARGGPVVA